MRNWPTGALTPSIVVYTILSDTYFHWVALRMCQVVSLKTIQNNIHVTYYVGFHKGTLVHGHKNQVYMR